MRSLPLSETRSLDRVPDTQRRMHYFLLLSHEDQIAAVLRLHRSGMSDTTIATAAGLAVEQVRKLRAEAIGEQV